MSPDGYRLWVNKGGTVLVRLWDDGTLEVCSRESPHGTWGPPMTMQEEI